jgi:large subunit ribosomal protein L13
MKPVERKTHALDASGQIVGRFASRIAFLLMGKGKRSWARNVDGGDYVEVLNVRGIQTTGKKLTQKEYKHFSGYPGGLKRVKWETLLTRDPKKLLRLAVYRMLPKNKLRSRMINRLKIE